MQWTTKIIENTPSINEIWIWSEILIFYSPGFLFFTFFLRIWRIRYIYNRVLGKTPYVSNFAKFPIYTQYHTRKFIFKKWFHEEYEIRIFNIVTWTITVKIEYDKWLIRYIRTVAKFQPCQLTKDQGHHHPFQQMTH